MNSPEAAFSVKTMLRMKWVLFFGAIYLIGGLLFPISLWKEFGCAPYSGTLGESHGGVDDFARLYPHLVLYPLFWLPLALVSLMVGLKALYDAWVGTWWRLLVTLPVVAFALISLLMMWVESRNPYMMLFEFSREAQSLPISTLAPNRSVEGVGPTLAEDIIGAVKNGRIPEAEAAPIQALRTELFAWGGMAKKQYLSRSRPFYLLSFAVMCWMMLSTYYSTILLLFAKGAPTFRAALLAVSGAVAGLVLWFPHRIYYNGMTKAVLFGIPSIPGEFDVWIPEILRKAGVTATEALPILFFSVSLVILGVLILTPQRVITLINLLGTLVTILGATLSGAVLWGALNPERLGAVLGLNGNWPRFIVVSGILITLFISYLALVFAALLSPNPPSSKKAVNDRDGNPPVPHV